MPRALTRVVLGSALLAGALIATLTQWLSVALILANTSPGQAVLMALVRTSSAGTIRIDGLSGSFPAALRAGRVTVADAGGTWLTLSGVAFDWRPARLIHGEAAIDRLEARTVTLTRLPADDGGGGASPAIPALPVALAKLSIARLEVGPAIVPMEAGRTLALSVAGSGDLSGNTGQAHLLITAPRPDAGPSQDRHASDRYVVDLAMDQSRLHGTLTVQEAADGLIAGLAQLPNLGALSARVAVDGPRQALATKANIEAGPLRASVDGTLDLTGDGNNLTASVTAQAMSPGRGVQWASVRLDATVLGSLRDPRATGTLSADGLAGAGASLDSLRANITAAATGTTVVHATLTGPRVPGPAPDLFAGQPLTLDASAQLADPRPLVRFTLRHPLAEAEGTADATSAKIHLTIPDLSPFTAPTGADLPGSASLDLTAAQSNRTVAVTITGGVAVTGGMRPVPSLVGSVGTIDLAASVTGDDVRLTHLTLGGAGFHASATGQYTGGRLDADWALSLPDLSAIQPGLAGTIETHGHAGGRLEALSVSGDLTGDIATQGQRLEQVYARLTVDGLPDAPTGHLTAGGNLLGAPLDVAAGASRSGGAVHLVVERGNWKSLTVGGMLDFAPGQPAPAGDISLSMSRLADLAPLIGQPLSGSITASLTASPALAHLKAELTGASLPAAGAVARAALDATIENPGGQPSVDATMNLDGLETNGIRASGRVLAKGAWDDLALTLEASSAVLNGHPARIETSGRLNGDAKTLAVASARAVWGPETVALLAPARVAFNNGVAVDRLRLSLRQGELTLGGGWDARGAMDVRATLSNLPVDVIAMVMPDLAADGTISGEARLTGTPSRPEGTIRLSASGLRSRNGSGRLVPPAVSTLNATLDGMKARVDGKFTAGGSSVTASGVVPLNRSGALDLRATGSLDLAMLSPLLEAQGRTVKGRVDLALAVAGAVASPRINGTIRLDNGDFQDFGVGAHIASISAEARVDGDTIRLDRLTATAGQGTLSAAGTMAIAEPRVVDLSLRASNARILSTDLANAVIDADLTLRGAMNASPVVAGTVTTRTVDIQVPDKLPPSIAVLPLRDPKARVARSPPAPGPDVALNVTLDAPGRIYVRGRGLDAELGGRIVFAGTASRPLSLGNLKLRRGTFNLVGQSLTLTEGTIDFSGGALTNPQLKLVATSSTASIAATLTISGDVKDPKIALSSVPDEPQDEILSQLLFNSVRTRLNAFQVAQVGAALATISGVGLGGGDPLGSVRSALGLDELSVGGGAGGAPGLTAGRYIRPGVRIGATQSASGGGTQATVQIDLAKGLKLESSTGSTTQTATGSTPTGASVGLTYEFEY